MGNDQRWRCENCLTVYAEYVNGCPRCWDRGIRAKVVAELGDGEPSPPRSKYYCACCKNLCEKPGIWCNYCFIQIAMNSKHKCDQGAAQEVSPHHYISTACLHEQHEKCRRFCKYCGVACACKNCVHAEEVSPPSPDDWISVQDKLPEFTGGWKDRGEDYKESSLVLIRTKGGKTVTAQFLQQVTPKKSTGAWACGCGDGDWKAAEVTHWKPLAGDTRELKAALREARGMLKILTRRLRPESVQEFLDRTERLLGEPTKE